MGKLIDLTGKRFCFLTVVERADYNIDNRPVWRCRCDCGNIVDARGECLRKGHTKCCGCGLARMKQGMSRTKLYSVLDGMRSRCYNPRNARYKDYGARGITVCDQWMGRQGRENFLNWAVQNGYKEGLSIDRIDVNGNYEPGNCRWTTDSVQMFNRQKRPSRLGLRGVYYIEDKHKYRVEIRCNRQTHYLGYYKDLEEAKEVRKRAELKYYGQVLD